MDFYSEFTKEQEENSEYRKIAVGIHTATLDNAELNTENSAKPYVNITWKFLGTNKLAWQRIPFMPTTVKLSSWQCRELGIMEEIKEEIKKQNIEKPDFLTVATAAYTAISKQLNTERNIDVTYRSYIAADGSTKEAMSVIIKSNGVPEKSLYEENTFAASKPLEGSFNKDETVPF